MFKLLKELIVELIIYYKNKNSENTWVDIEMLPKSFGETVEERIQTFLRYKKLGINIIKNHKEE